MGEGNDPLLYNKLPMVDSHALRTFLDGHHEWLLVRETGRTFAIDRREIAIEETKRASHFGFLDDDGFHTWRLKGFELDRSGISIDVAGGFAQKSERMRLVPRLSSSELSSEVELARLLRANEIARLIEDSRPGVKLGRVGLNTENGRLAHIDFDLDDTGLTAIADVTASLPVERLISIAILRLEKLGARRKHPVNDAWIVCEKRQARSAQKLHAMLTERWKCRLTILEIVRKSEPPTLIELPKRTVRELWREKARSLRLPEAPSYTKTADQILKLGSEEIDIVTSQQGETLRFRGFPFARVRTILGQEQAWFGIGRHRRLLTHDNRNELDGLVGQLKINRAANAPNKRHEYYRAASEAWLESILRRNINLLDANLVLSPLYNQFRSSSDKIDLLALRRDGRLVIVELKTQPDREIVFQAVDYWRKIELQRRRGMLRAANLFDGREILDKPALVYLVAPAWSFHRDCELFARCVDPEIELWRFELHQNWRECVKVLARQNYADVSL